MAILEKEVWVGVGSRMDKHYESLGYVITRRKNKQGRFTVPPDTKILVKVEHLSAKSGVRVTKVCDDCGKLLPNKSYCQIITDREKNKGKDNCKSCSTTKMNANRLKNIKYEQSMEYHAKENAMGYLMDEYSIKNEKKPNQIYKSSSIKYLWNCPKCKSEYKATCANRIRGNNCPYCAGQKVNRTNCIWNTHPEIAKLLKNPQRGYEITSGRSGKELFICNNCNHESEKSVYNVVNQGFPCLCSDGISYPEKFLMSVLIQSGVNFKMQKVFNWSKSINHKNKKLSGKKKYDFYIPDYNMIIETHGMQHYEEGFKGIKTLKEQQENDALKEKIAKENGIVNYVTIDCKYSEMEYIKNNIIKSKIDMFISPSIDWLKCHEEACASLIKATCDLWNGGIKSTLIISETLNLARNTIIKYLKQGLDLGMCDYDPSENKGSLIESKQIVQLSLEGNFIKEYSSMAEASKDLNIKKGTIWACCKGKLKTAGDFRWMYKDAYNGLQYKLKPIVKEPRKRKIIQLDKDGVFIKEWESAREVSRIIGIGHRNISSCLRGNTRTAGGFKWMYKKDYEKIFVV